LNGAEIARKRVVSARPFAAADLRADIDYGTAEASDTYGVIALKCWNYQGENVPKRNTAGAGKARGGAAD